jgi:ubiquinone biosynthesis protein Coq4
MEHKKRKGEETMEYSCQQVLKKMERMFKAGIKKFPECTKLRMSYAFFQLEQLRNKERAYEEFTNSSRIDPTFQQQFNIYRFKKIIRENLEDREESEADLIETIRFQNSVSLL